jgi:hypothetical protein
MGWQDVPTHSMDLKSFSDARCVHHVTNSGCQIHKAIASFLFGARYTNTCAKTKIAPW